MVKYVIVVKKETRERLKQIGKKGQSYDDIIINLLDCGNNV